MNLMDHLAEAENNLFRFEYLQSFEEDQKYLDLYLKTGTVDLSINQEWFDFIKTKNEEGVSTSRVRLIKYPMSKYIEF